MRPKDAALCFDRPILRAEFRYVTRNQTARWYWDMIEWERKARSRVGYLVPYQCTEVDGLRPTHREGRYVPLHRHFENVEVPRGCLVDLPPVLTYKGVEMMNNPRSGPWAVFYSEYAARAAAFILWEVYDRYKLWYLSETLRGNIRLLKLDYILGSPGDAEELLELLDVIDSIDWSAVPAAWAQRGSRVSDFSPGRNVAGAGDFIYYDPWACKRLASREEAEALRHLPDRRTIPARHPRGFRYRGSFEDSADYDETEPADAEGGPHAGGSSRMDVDAESGNPERVVQEFLRSAGVAPDHLTGDMAAMRDFVARMVGAETFEEERPPDGGKPTSGDDADGSERNARFQRGRQKED